MGWLGCRIELDCVVIEGNLGEAHTRVWNGKLQEKELQSISLARNDSKLEVVKVEIWCNGNGSSALSDS